MPCTHTHTHIHTHTRISWKVSCGILNQHQQRMLLLLLQLNLVFPPDKLAFAPHMVLHGCGAFWDCCCCKSTLITMDETTREGSPTAMTFCFIGLGGLPLFRKSLCGTTQPSFLDFRLMDILSV